MCGDAHGQGGWEAGDHVRVDRVRARRAGLCLQLLASVRAVRVRDQAGEGGMAVQVGSAGEKAAWCLHWPEVTLART